MILVLVATVVWGYVGLGAASAEDDMTGAQSGLLSGLLILAAVACGAFAAYVLIFR
jgi:hypothetical protein